MRSLLNKFAGLAVLFAAGALFAQPANDKAPPPSITSEFDQLGAAEMTTQIPVLEKEVTDANKIVVILQINARKEKDVIKLTCINEKLIQLKAMRNLFESARDGFYGAVTVQLQREQFAEVSGKAQGIRLLKEEALLCAGEQQFQSEMKNDWDGPDVPDDPAKDLFPDGVEPPGFASPFN